MSTLRTAGVVGALTSARQNNDQCQPAHYSVRAQTCGPDVLWIRPGSLGSAGQSFNGNLNSHIDCWDWDLWLASDGKVGQRRDGITGVTRDINNSPVGSVQVKLFDKATDLLVDTVTSDANGNFTATTPFTGQPVYARAVNVGNTLFGATAALTPS